MSNPSTPTVTKRGRGRTRTEVPSVRALERGLAVMEELARTGEAALSDIARATDLTGSTTFRILETLCQRGYAHQDEISGRYRLGAGAIQLGAAYINRSALPKTADSDMQQLVARVNETVNLAVKDGQQVVYIHQVESNQSVRMFTQLGARAPLYCTGVGKVLLAWRDPLEVERTIEQMQFEAFTSSTITSRQALLDEL